MHTGAAFAAGMMVWFAGAASAADPGGESLSTARAAAVRPIGGEVASLSGRTDFTFQSFKAWLRSDGSWHIDGWVQHTGLRCATYAVGMRFGVGRQGCNDVEWLGEAEYLTRQRQCNNAPVRHTGGSTAPQLAARYADISCAEQFVRCRGTCK